MYVQAYKPAPQMYSVYSGPMQKTMQTQGVIGVGSNPQPQPQALALVSLPAQPLAQHQVHIPYSSPTPSLAMMLQSMGSAISLLNLISSPAGCSQIFDHPSQVAQVKGAIEGLLGPQEDPRLTAAENLAVWLHLAGVTTEMGKDLRSGNSSRSVRWTSMVRTLSNAISKLPRHVGYTVRFMNLTPQELARYHVGAQIDWLSFASCTKSSTPSSCSYFGNTEFTVWVQWGADISSLSPIVDEKEVLLPPSRFVVVKRQGRKVVLKQVAIVKH